MAFDARDDCSVRSIATAATVATAATEGSARSYLNSVSGFRSNVLDDYVILPKVLGEGKYGLVRECVSRRTGQTRACKSVDKSFLPRLDHLQQEIDIVTSLRHPHVLKTAGCYEDEECVHIVTEKYTGDDLFEAIMDRGEGGRFSEREAADIIAPLLEAVAYIHSKNVAHRDIKPENILFASHRRGDIRLVDFGLAQRHGEGEAPMWDRCGTAYYMAPELLRGRYYKSCDLWSAGVILYILLSGVVPFDGETDHDVHRSILQGQCEFHPQQWEGVSEEAQDLVAGLLERDPKRRYTAKEALGHPWIRKATKGRRRKREERKKAAAPPGRTRGPPIKYLKIP